jgi:hypothetical protein
MVLCKFCLQCLLLEMLSRLHCWSDYGADDQLSFWDLHWSSFHRSGWITGGGCMCCAHFFGRSLRLRMPSNSP